MQVVGGLARLRGASPALRLWARMATRDHLPGAAGRPARDMTASSKAGDATFQTSDRDFDEFYARHEQPLYGYLRRLAPTREIAMELAQETFIRAWRHFDLLRAYDRPEAWLYHVATNLAISHLRRRRPLSFSALLAHLRVTSPERIDVEADDLFASTLDLESAAAERDLIDRILRALPERQRAALLLAAIQGFTSEEIATTLAVTPDNARKLLSRGREQFRDLYDQAQRRAR